MKEIIIDTQQSAEVIWKDDVLSKIDEYQPIVKEAITLFATKCPPFMWRNLSRKAYDITTQELINNIKKEFKIQIKKQNFGKASRVLNVKASINDSSSVQKAIYAGANKFPFLCLFRKEGVLEITWFN